MEHADTRFHSASAGLFAMQEHVKRQTKKLMSRSNGGINQQTFLTSTRFICIDPGIQNPLYWLFFECRRSLSSDVDQLNPTQTETDAFTESLRKDMKLQTLPFSVVCVNKGRITRGEYYRGIGGFVKRRKTKDELRRLQKNLRTSKKRKKRRTKRKK